MEKEDVDSVQASVSSSSDTLLSLASVSVTHDEHNAHSNYPELALQHEQRGYHSARCHRRRRSSSISRSGGGRDYYSDESENDSPYQGERIYTLPTSTSEWNVVCLESLGIFYHHAYFSSPLHILDKVFQETGCFGPLKGSADDYVKCIQKTMSFSASVGDIITVHENIEKVIKQLMIQMKEDIENITTLKVPEGQEHLRNATLGSLQDFITGTRRMISLQAAYMKNKNFPRLLRGAVPEHIFVDILKKFTSLCHLIPLPGSAFVARKMIYHNQKVSVSSESDIVLLPKEDKDDFLENALADTFPVIAVVTVKSLKHAMCRGEEENKTRSHRDCSEELQVHSKPAICQNIRKETLGQHGGQLLMHHDIYKRGLTTFFKNSLLGMIVIGTQVIFTLLEITTGHLDELELKDKKKKNTGGKAKIYYSEPKDILKKEDRDILLESLSRLNNVK